MDDRVERLYLLLNQLIDSVININHLLLDDQTLFKKNDTNNINANNDKKIMLLNNLSYQIQQLQAFIPMSEDGLFSSLRNYVNQLEQPHADKINSLIQSLQMKLSDGYNQLITNNSVVVSNLGFLKEVWEKLSGLSNATYENPRDSA